MKLREIFGQDNPFQNLIVAGPSTAKHPLRGHEELLNKRLENLDKAINYPDYPNSAQHTIVFGEWGHGKSHLLRIFENTVNNNYCDRAYAVYFEPSEFGTEGIFLELCRKLGITAKDSAEFIEKVQIRYPENLFLLIDETQAMVGEELSESFIEHFKQYWEMIDGLKSSAANKLYGLHVFHGLSLNSAQEIYRVGKIDSIKDFNHYLYLASLDEESQWQMFCDHLNAYLQSNDMLNIQPDDLIRPGVNRCIQVLTGGNPRFALSLMQQIFYRALRQDLSMIDGSICYKTLCETPRLDASGLYYFDHFTIKDVLKELSDGKIFERKISNMLHEKISTLLGEWEIIDQNTLADYDLRTTEVRRKCSSLKEPIVLFDQPPGEDHFRLTNDFLRLINVEQKNTITEVEDKEDLLRLQLEPEKMISNMVHGLNLIMTHNHYYSTPKDLRTEIPLSILVTNLGGRLLRQNIKAGVMVYKGKEIPTDVYKKISEEIETGSISVMIIIEDANVRHDNPESSFEHFKQNYQGNLNLDKRFLFINGTDPGGQVFDEDFFVHLLKIHIDEVTARTWFERLQIKQRLKQVEEDLVYCPDLNEQTLIEELLRKNRSFKIGEIKALDDSFNWVNKQRLEKLEDYIGKDGASYETLKIEEISPFKYTLAKLQSSEDGLTIEEIEDMMITKYILTGKDAAKEDYADWVIRVLQEQNKVQKQNNKIFFKDLERELMSLKQDYEEECKGLEEIISKYRSQQIDDPKLEEIDSKKQETKHRLDEIERSGTDVLKIHEFKNAVEKIKELKNQLDRIPGQVRETLQKQFDEINKNYEKVKNKTTWPVENMSNPYRALFSIDEVENSLSRLSIKIQNDVPNQKGCRREMQDIKEKLSALEDLLDKEVLSGTYTNDDLDRCIFLLFNAIKNNKKGKVKIHY